MAKVFLGGTCNGSLWREGLIPLLKIDHFNPVVPDWTEECMEEERRQRELCDFVLYTITPKMSGVYSIAEAIDDSNKRPERTVFCLLLQDRTYDEHGNLLRVDHWTEGQYKSLDQVGKMVERNGGKYFNDLVLAAHFMWQHSKNQDKE